MSHQYRNLRVDPRNPLLEVTASFPSTTSITRFETITHQHHASISRKMIFKIFTQLQLCYLLRHRKVQLVDVNATIVYRVLKARNKTLVYHSIHKLFYTIPNNYHTHAIKNVTDTGSIIIEFVLLILLPGIGDFSIAFPFDIEGGSCIPFTCVFVVFTSPPSKPL